MGALDVLLAFGIVAGFALFIIAKMTKQTVGELITSIFSEPPPKPILPQQPEIQWKSPQS